MTIRIDARIRRIVLGWLKRGEIDTLELPEMYDTEENEFTRLIGLRPMEAPENAAHEQ